MRIHLQSVVNVVTVSNVLHIVRVLHTRSDSQIVNDCFSGLYSVPGTDLDSGDTKQSERGGIDKKLVDKQRLS